MVLSCICWWLWENSAESSLKSRSSTCISSLNWIPCFLCNWLTGRKTPSYWLFLCAMDIFMFQEKAGIFVWPQPSLGSCQWTILQGYLHRSFLDTSSWLGWPVWFVRAVSIGSACPRFRMPFHRQQSWHMMPKAAICPKLQSAQSCNLTCTWLVSVQACLLASWLWAIFLLSAMLG